MNITDMEKWINEESAKKTKEKEASADDLEFGVQVVIDNMVFQKVMHWVNKSNFEVSGLGNVIYDPETNIIRVIDAIILPQKNTASTTDIDGAAVAKAMFMLRNSPGEMKWWWHSHVNMGVFWSGTDISTIKQLGSGGWFAATVFNKKQETKSAYCQNGPIRLLVPEVPTHVSSPANDELIRQWDTEYEKNVENVTYSFRGRYEAKEIVKGSTQEAKETSAQDQEWEEIVDAVGEITGYQRKKNIVPVERKRLSESNFPRNNPNQLETKPGQEEMEDLASTSELERWERSTSDEEAKMGLMEDDGDIDAYEMMMRTAADKDYGD